MASHNGFFSLIFGNIASKIVGVFREALFAAWFGTSDVAAAYRIAQTAYLLPTHGLVGDSLSAGLLPLYKQIGGEDQDNARLLVLVAIFYGIFFSGIVTLCLYCYADQIAFFIAPGASRDAQNIAGVLLRIMALSTPFYVLSGMLGYLETAYGKFGAIAWRPMILNIGSVAGASLAVYLKADHWLATALVISHIIFFLRTLMGIRSLDRIMPERPATLEIIFRVSSRFVLNMAPLLGLPLAAQLNVLAERIVSSWMGTSVIPSVDYARIILETGTQLLAVPLGIVTMAAHGGSSGAEAKAYILKVSSLLVVLSFPVSVLIALNATSIVTIIFARGRFDTHAVANTSAVLVWMGAGLGFIMTSYYLIKALNAQMRNVESFVITVVACAINMLVNFTLWKYLGPQTIGLGALCYGFVLFFFCVVRLGFWPDLRRLCRWIFVACCIQSLLTCGVVELTGYPYNFLASCLIALLIWAPLFFIVSGPIKEAMLPISGKLQSWLGSFGQVK